MTEFPEFVAGTHGFSTEVMKAGNKMWIGKTGAEGVFGFGVRGSGLGIAIKVEDGSERGR